MLRTAARALAAATLVAALLVPAVPAAAAPADGGGWVVALLDAVAGWLAPLGRIAAPRGAETSTDIGPDALAAASSGDRTHPDVDPKILATEPTGPQCSTTDEDGEALPNLDPNG